MSEFSPRLPGLNEPHSVFNVWKQNELPSCDWSMFCCDCRSRPGWKARLSGWINNARNQGEMKRWKPQLRDRQKKREEGRGEGENNTWSGQKNETPERTNKRLCKGCRDIMDFTHKRTHAYTHTGTWLSPVCPLESARAVIVFFDLLVIALLLGCQVSALHSCPLTSCHSVACLVFERERERKEDCQRCYLHDCAGLILPTYSIWLTKWQLNTGVRAKSTINETSPFCTVQKVKTLFNIWGVMSQSVFKGAVHLKRESPLNLCIWGNSKPISPVKHKRDFLVDNKVPLLIQWKCMR